MQHRFRVALVPWRFTMRIMHHTDAPDWRFYGQVDSFMSSTKPYSFMEPCLGGQQHLTESERGEIVINLSIITATVVRGDTHHLYSTSIESPNRLLSNILRTNHTSCFTKDRTIPVNPSRCHERSAHSPANACGATASPQA